MAKLSRRILSSSLISPCLPLMEFASAIFCSRAITRSPCLIVSARISFTLTATSFTKGTTSFTSSTSNFPVATSSLPCSTSKPTSKSFSFSSTWLRVLARVLVVLPSSLVNCLIWASSRSGLGLASSLKLEFASKNPPREGVDVCSRGGSGRSGVPRFPIN